MGGWVPPAPFVVLACGGRDYADARTVFRALDLLHGNPPITLLVHGAARGADSLAALWAEVRFVPVRAFPADWIAEPRRGGILRNTRMLTEGRPNLVVAFPGGRGTAHMVGIARQAGVRVIEIPR